MDGATVTSRARPLSLAEAHLTAWTAFAVINFLTILASSASLGTRLLLGVFDFGHMAAVGLGGYGLLRAVGPRRGLAVPIVAALAILVGLTWIAPDFQNFAERHNHPQLWRLLGAVAALGVPAALVAGRVCAHPALHWGALVTAAFLVAINHHVLAADYRGIHLLIAWTATALATGALTRVAAAGAVYARFKPQRAKRYAIATVVPLASLSLASLIVLPPRPVLAHAFRVEGSILFPFLVGLHDDDQEIPELVGSSRFGVSQAFMQSRDKLPDISSSLPPLDPERPIVILITIDAMRAELLLKEAWRDRLPRMRDLAASSVHFTRARSPGASTRNTLGQVFASKYSSQLRWSVKKGLGRNLRDDSTPRLSNLLGDAGFETIHLSTYPNLVSKHAIVGTFKHEVRLKADREGQRFALSDAVVGVAIEQLKTHGAGAMFLYMHWLDAHDPYDAAGSSGDTFERYLREVALCDQALGKLLDALARQKLLSRTILVVTADHGEGLGDHGIPYHAKGLYEAIVRVPLIINVPGIEARRVDVPVTTLDLAPTLLDLLGLPTPGQYMGQSLVGFLRGDKPRLERPIGFDESRIRLRGMMHGQYKIIDDRKRHTIEIYDVLADPAEQHNLFGSLPDGQDQHLLGLSRGFFATHDVKSTDEDLAEEEL